MSSHTSQACTNSKNPCPLFIANSYIPSSIASSSCVPGDSSCDSSDSFLTSLSRKRKMDGGGGIFNKKWKGKGKLKTEKTEKIGNQFWEPENVAYFVECMHWMFQQGRMLNGNFSAKVYEDIAEQMQGYAPKPARVPWTASQLGTKSHVLKTNWGKFQFLLNVQTGWGINNENGKLTYPEGAWVEYVAAHPTTFDYDKNSLPNYNIMTDMWSDKTATGNYAMTGCERHPVDVDAESPEEVFGGYASANSNKRSSGDWRAEDVQGSAKQKTNISATLSRSLNTMEKFYKQKLEAREEEHASVKTLNAIVTSFKPEVSTLSALWKTVDTLVDDRAMACAFVDWDRDLQLDFIEGHAGPIMNNNWDCQFNAKGGSGSEWNGGVEYPNIPWPQWHTNAWKTNFRFRDLITEEEEEANALMIMLILGPSRRYWMPRTIRNNSICQGEIYMSEVFTGTPENFLYEFRMRKPVFMHLVNEMVSRGYLFVGRNATVSPYESFAIFIQTCAKGHAFRDSQNRFQHSNEMVHRHFVKCLEALVQFAPHVIVPPNFNTVHSRISSDQRFYSYFKDCIGAIDGTHIPACIPTSQHRPWYNRKGLLTQNVMAICDFDGMFTYVYPGWAESAHDSRVMNAAETTDPNYPHPPPGKYYLVDSGYTNRPRYVAPYMNILYHVPEWEGLEPQSPKELFNKRHSSLRNAIERAFGVLKRRFPILKGNMPSFTIQKHVQLVTACCVVHNFITRFDTVDKYMQPEPDDEDLDLNWERYMTEDEQAAREIVPTMAVFKDEMALAMWENRHG